MSIKFTKPAEAFAAVAWLICTADKLGSIQESDFLYKQVKGLSIFRDYSRIEFQNLMGAAFSRVFQRTPEGELSTSEQGQEGVIQSVREALSPELRVEAYRMAVGLAKADGLCAEEAAVIERLQHALEIDEETARAISKSEQARD